MSDISHHQRATVKRIQDHPTTHNLEWDDVIALLNGMAEVTERHDGKFAVSLGGHKIVLTKPRHKDVDEQMVNDLTGNADERDRGRHNHPGSDRFLIRPGPTPPRAG